MTKAVNDPAAVSVSQRPGPAPGRPAAQERVLGDGVLVAQGRGRRPDAEVELLPQVLPGPVLRPDVPHAHVVQGHVDRRPRSGVHLMETDNRRGGRISRESRPRVKFTFQDRVRGTTIYYGFYLMLQY